MSHPAPSHHTCVFTFQVIIKNKKAVGVEVIKDGRKHIINVNREIILSAGAVNTPQILMLSGIGPKKHLESLTVS
jgi:choline dehydrogenase